MNCPSCDQPTRVIDSRTMDRIRWRRRICINGHRFNTHEVEVLKEMELIAPEGWFPSARS